MKIAYINTLYSPHIGGGAELVLKAQVEAMAAAGHDVSVSAIGPDEGVAAETIDGIPVERVGHRNLYFHGDKVDRPSHKKLIWHLRDRDNHAMASAARRFVERVRPDVVCCHNLAGWSVGLWREVAALRVPIVQVLHDQYLRCVKSTMFRRGSNCTAPCIDCRLLRHRHAQASSQVTAVIGVSDFVLQRMLTAGYFGRTPIREVLYNFGAARRASPRKRRFGCEGGGPLRIGFIGFLVPSKGIEWLLETLKQAPTLPHELLIAGRGEPGYEAELRRRHEDARTKFLGFVSPESFFEQIDIAVVPSLWNDTLPSVVFEALGQGVPVLGSRRGGIPEMVVDGVNGYLFDTEEPGQLVRRLESIVGDAGLLARLAENCVASARKFYDVPGWVRAQERIFERALAHHAGSAA